MMSESPTPTAACVPFAMSVMMLTWLFFLLVRYGRDP